MSRLRRIVPMVALAAGLAVFASCTASKKYGCPESMNFGSILNY
jgi:hypothetical protein